MLVDTYKNTAEHIACAHSKGLLVMVTTIKTLTRFPVKGLSGQTLDSVQLVSGQGFPGDRKFGFARPDSGFDINNPQPLPKSKFYTLARDASLALLKTEFDDRTGMLSMSTSHETHQFDISTSQGKDKAGEFLKMYLSLPENESPQLYEASPHRFTDVAVVSSEMMNSISIINSESVNKFSESIGVSVDPMRFRGNILISNLTPFAELDMLGKEFSIGNARLKIVKRTRRCPATEVNLETGERDIKTPKLLKQHFDHMDMGVYAEVLAGGTITPGEVVKFN